MSHEGIDCQPNLKELIAFSTRSHAKINIPKQIGVRYKEFGVQLPKDPNGTGVSNIVEKRRGDSQRIYTEILRSDCRENVERAQLAGGHWLMSCKTLSWISLQET